MRTFSMSVLMLFAMCSGAEANGGDYSIEGTVRGAKNEEVTLARMGEYVGFTYEPIAKAPIEDGSFAFSGELAHGQLLYLKFSEPHAVIPVFVDASSVHVTIDLTSPDDAVVTGSAIHDRFRIVSDTYQGLEEKEGKAFLIRYVSEGNDPIVAAYILSRHLSNNMDLSELEPLVSGLAPSLAEHPYTQLLLHRIDVLRSVQIGMMAPDFALSDTQGAAVSLSSMRGKYLLLDFWASWCAPCRNANKELVNIYRDFREMGFEIVGVSLDFPGNRQAWLQAVDNDGLTWTNLSDLKGFNTEAAQKYAVRKLPTSVLIDPKGTIIAKDLLPEQLRGELADLLGEPADDGR